MTSVNKQSHLKEEEDILMKYYELMNHFGKYINKVNFDFMLPSFSQYMRH